MNTEIEVLISALFVAKNNREFSEIKKTNTELKDCIDKSNNTLKGMIDVNKLMPPSAKAE